MPGEIETLYRTPAPSLPGAGMPICVLPARATWLFSNFMRKTTSKPVKSPAKSSRYASRYGGTSQGSSPRTHVSGSITRTATFAGQPGLGRFAEAVAALDRVVELAEPLSAARPHAPGDRRMPSRTMGPRRSGRRRVAARRAARDRYDVACLYAKAATGAHADSRAAKAIAILGKLRGDGFFREKDHSELLRKDEDLALLRGRPDFKALSSDH